VCIRSFLPKIKGLDLHCVFHENGHAKLLMAMEVDIIPLDFANNDDDIRC